MNSGTVVGALALGTLGLGFVAIVWHFLSQLRDPKNRFQARNIFFRDGKAASTSTAENAEPGSQLSKPLVVRLNESIDSQHEMDPTATSSRSQRAADFNRERAGDATNE